MCAGTDAKIPVRPRFPISMLIYDAAFFFIRKASSLMTILNTLRNDPKRKRRKILRKTNLAQSLAP
jgi:hypothetical protein